MYSLYGNVSLNTDQKLAYLGIMAYILDESPNNDMVVNRYMMHFIKQMNLNENDFNKLFIPTNKEEIYQALKPISTRNMALDLLHYLWFIASINNAITDREIEIIRQTAEVLKIDDDKLLAIHNLVNDEFAFLEQAKSVLEIDEIFE